MIVNWLSDKLAVESGVSFEFSVALCPHRPIRTIMDRTVSLLLMLLYAHRDHRDYYGQDSESSFFNVALRPQRLY